LILYTKINKKKRRIRNFEATGGLQTAKNQYLKIADNNDIRNKRNKSKDAKQKFQHNNNIHTITSYHTMQNYFKE